MADYPWVCWSHDSDPEGEKANTVVCFAARANACSGFSARNWAAHRNHGLRNKPCAERGNCWPQPTLIWRRSPNDAATNTRTSFPGSSGNATASSRAPFAGSKGDDRSTAWMTRGTRWSRRGSIGERHDRAGDDVEVLEHRRCPLLHPGCSPRLCAPYVPSRCLRHRPDAPPEPPRRREAIWLLRSEGQQGQLIKPPINPEDEKA